MLQQAVERSFNMVSVDTDTSTSDTVLLLANGLAGEVDLTALQTALNEVCIYLAKAIARDGEGASKLRVRSQGSETGQTDCQGSGQFSTCQDRSIRC
jgi:glutamate N-acetyltransferase/amino-acid N-acetyltransferase